MKPPHTNWRGTGYNDERRDSYNSRANTWRSDERDRGRDREYVRDSERDRDRHPIRRESRDGRDGRDAGDERGRREPREPQGAPDSRSPKRHNEPPRAPRIQTAIPTGPRKSPSVNSPASSRGGKQSARPTPTELFPDKTFPSPITPAPTTPFTPKAKDPKLQGYFERMHKCSKTWQELQSLQQRKDQLLHDAPQRQNEAAFLRTNSADFPAYLEFEAKFRERESAECADLDKRIRSAEQRLWQKFEEAATSYPTSHALKPPEPVVVKDPAISSLEARFDEFTTRAEQQQKQLAEATNEIRSLLAAKEKSDQDLVVLQTDVQVLKSDYSKLEAENARLRDQISGLNADVDMRIVAAESRITESVPNTAMVEEVGRIKSSFEILTDRENEQSKWKNKIEERLKASEGAQHVVNSKVEKLGNQMENLDFDTIDEINDFWVNHDLRRKVLADEKNVNSLRTRVESLDKTIQEVQQEILSLKSQHTRPQPVASESSSATALPSRQAFETLFREKLGPVEKSLRSMMMKHAKAQDELIGGMIDDSNNKIQNLEEKVTRQMDGKEARINSLEARVQSTAIEPEALNDFAVRIAELQEKRLSPRVDKIAMGLSKVEKEVSELSTNIGQLENHYQELNGVSSPAAAYDAFIKSEIKGELDDTKRKVEALGLSVRSLDSQWSNVNSKQMAERILQQLNPLAQSIEARITKAENRFQQEQAILRRDQTDLVENFRSMHGMLAAVSATSIGDKRPAPSSPQSEAKKRKLETNGRDSLPPLRNGSVSSSEFQRSAS
ncbi:hypothetical protein F4810DRAFT_529752 [Camillea tinctor]|nr:hypothetical protein F4810DRAFT_529752 [Camillea tinctor]